MHPSHAVAQGRTMVPYSLDPKASRFAVQAFATGLLSGWGHNPTFAVRDYKGLIRFAPDAPAETSFEMTVNSDSLSLTDAVTIKDRVEIESQMRREVLKSAAFPEIVFHSTQTTGDKISDNWYRLILTGDLIIGGVNKAHEVDVQVRLSDDALRLTGQSRLLLSSYGLHPVTALGGLIKVKDELKIDFDLVAHKTEE